MKKRSSASIAKARKRAISAMTAAVMFASVCPFNELNDLTRLLKSTFSMLTANAVESHVMNSRDDMVTYSQVVAADPQAHQNDVIQLAFNSGVGTQEFNNDVTGNFLPLGTETNPFGGKIEISATSLSPLNLEVPLFDYVYDDVQIIGSSGLSFTRTKNGKGLPILANHVVHRNGSTSDWNIVINAFAGENTNSYGGIIGTMDTGSFVSIAVSDNTSANIYRGSGDVGRICNTMAENSTLNVKALSGNGANTISTASGHAGGLVGRMADGSKLILSADHSSLSPTITAAGDGSYAGGLIGYCDGGSIMYGTSITELTGEAYNLIASYEEGDFVNVGGNLYIVTDDIETAWSEESIGFQTVSVDTFSDTDTYASGAIVEKESTYYRCTVESSVGTWEDTSSNFEQLSVSDVVGATEYTNGDYVTNSGVLYQCVAEAGAAGSNLLHYCSATTYDMTSSYSQNNYVLNNGGLYVCTAAEGASALSASLTAISEFSDESPYAVDDIVLHENKIYRCIQAHEAGVWSDEDFGLEVEVTDLFDSYTLNQTVNGVAGAGGLIGWYRPSFTSGSAEIDISKYNLQSSDAVAKLKATSATGDVGGLYGVLCNATAVNEGTLTGDGGEIQIVGDIDNSLKSMNQGKTENYGGLIGKYKTSDLTSSLKIENTAASPSNDGGSDYYGGLIGKIDGAAYAELTNVAATDVDKLSGIFGGAVSSADEAFVKVKDIKVSIKENATFTGGGVIGRLTSGVLELAGKTDLSGAKPKVAADNGQIVGERDSALVFADAGWDLLRCDAVTVDDIGTWGNVVRFNDNDTKGDNKLFEQSSVFTIDTTAHTVTLNDVSISNDSASISSEADYAIFALNNQIRTESDVLKVGATVAADEDNDILESTNITFGSSIDLTGTGMTGLTRDALSKGADGKLAEKYLDYYGTVTGGTGISVKLAIGEPFGKRGNWNTNASGEGCGQIYRHSYLGLLGRTTATTTISNLTFKGIIHAKPQIDGFYVGSAAAKTVSNLTVAKVTVGSSDNTAADEMTIVIDNTDKTAYVGGLIGAFYGNASSSKPTLKIGDGSGNDCFFNAEINTTEATKANTGGVIGRIGSVENTSGYFTATIDRTTITGSVAGSDNVGGLIGYIVKSDKKEGRTLTLKSVTTTNLTVTNGAMLGDRWYDTQVVLNGVKINSGSKVVSTTNNADMAGLVYHATGRWQVTKVEINELDVDISATLGSGVSKSVNSFGVLVNKGYKTDATNSALFMWLPKNYTFTIGDSTHFASGSLLDSAPVFDEIVAYSANGDVTENGQGIVSIYTTKPTAASVNMDAIFDSRNTYNGQTDCGKKRNSHTRYYYNLDAFCRSSYSATLANPPGTVTLTDGQKLLAWSVGVYADSSLRGYFYQPYLGSTTNEVISYSVGAADTAFDMNNLSYYPVNVDSGMNVTFNGTVTLYNEELEQTVANRPSTGTSDTERSTLERTQHFLMHEGVFHNVGGTLTVGSATLKGSVGGLADGSGSGALVCGTIAGTDTTDMANFSVTTKIDLDGIKVHNHDTDYKASADTESVYYAPLLINKIGSFSTIDKIKGISIPSHAGTTADPNAYTSGQKAATSLIGKVGNSSATNITLRFEDITLDARKPASDLVTAEQEANTAADKQAAASVFDSVYHTTESIFTRATLLESFSYNSDIKGTGDGSYKYAYNKDWTKAGTGTEADPYTYTHIAQVTYGAEISLGATSQYNNEEYKYDGTSDYTSPLRGDDTLYADFDDEFLRYVAVAWSESNHTYQLKINHHSVGFQGCGTYDDPYIISAEDGALQFESIAELINGGTPSIVIGYPTGGGTWCSPKGSHKTYKWDSNANAYVEGVLAEDGVTFNATSGGATVAKNVMREYFSRAYYQLSGNVTLSNDFVGLASFSDANDKSYAFHGVIDGNDKILTNPSDVPLIVASYGCVIKDLTVAATNNSIEVKQSSITSFLEASGCNAYGAVIGKVMGGDNIIDNVDVSFSSTSKIKVWGTYAQLAPVGGYIGVVVQGGVYFRNMERSALTGGGTASNSNGLTNSNVMGCTENTTLPADNNSKWNKNLVDESTTKWLYVNPIIGRVINGFAVTESTDGKYRPYEDGTRTYINETVTWDDGAVTMRNGTKNYSIADISSGLGKLAVDSSYAISVPNGQSLYLLSLMINSGMSANGAKLGWKGTGMFSRRATYKYVGCGTNGQNFTAAEGQRPDNYALAKADYDKATLDTNDAGWLIRNYTADSTSITYAQSMANQSAATVTLSKSDYILPDGFRGIGNYYANEDALRLKLTELDGKEAVIYQNIQVAHYKTDTDNYLPPNDANSGVGLFTCQTQAGEYKDFTLHGNITSSVIDKGSGKRVMQDDNRVLSVGMMFGTVNGASDFEIKITNTALVNIDVYGARFTGGLIGRSRGVDIDIDITIDTIYDSKNIKVHGGYTTGGLIGQKNAEQKERGSISIDFHGHKLTIKEIVSETTSTTNSGNNKCGVGGLVGACRSNSSSKFGNGLTVQNLTIESASSEVPAYIKCQNNSIYYSYCVGGIIGSPNRTPITINNCNVYNICCETTGYAGGVTGFLSTASPADINNMHIESTMDGAVIGNNACTGAGGYIGATGGEDVVGLVVRNSSLQNYEVKAIQNVGGIIGNRSSSKDNAPSQSRQLILKNLKLTGCDLKGNSYVGGLIGAINFYDCLGYNIYTKDLSFKNLNDENSITNVGYVVGFNKQNTVAKTNNTQTADFNLNNLSDIKLVGFSRQNVPANAASLIGGIDTVTSNGVTTGEFGKEGYIVFADYQGTAANPTTNQMSPSNKGYNTFETAFKNSELTNVTIDYPTDDDTVPNWPNVSSSPAYILHSSTSGGTTSYSSLTGDGVSRINYDADINSGASKSAAKAILDDMLAGSSASKRYQNTGIPLTSDNANALTITKLSNWLGTEKKYSDFKSEFNTPSETLGLPKSFPVLLVDDVTIVNDLVNGYLQILTNTSYNYASSTEAAANAAVYKLNIANCEFDAVTESNPNGTRLFVPNYDENIYDTNSQTTKASLYTDGNVFKIRRYDNQDESKLQFTLIDLAFYDPSDTTHTNIAYHLYVPVFVKKQLRFTFEVSAKTGTDYLMSGYLTDANGNSLRGKTMIENFGNPVTMEFRYTYDRKLSEWKTLIESGTEFPNYSYNKILNVTSHTQEIPGPMTMLLLDPNASSKTNYIPNQVYTGGTITQVDSSNYTIDLESFSGYTRKTMNDFFSITLSTDAETKAFRAVTGNETADIIDKNGNRWKYVGTDEGSNATYGISEFKYADGRSGNDDKLIEDYYITFYTESPTLNSNCTFALAEAEAVDTDEAAQKAVMYVIDSSGNNSANLYTSASSFDTVNIREATLSEKKNANGPQLYTLEKIYHYDFSSPRTLGNTEFPTLISNSQAVNLYVGDLYATDLTVDTYHSDVNHMNQDEELTVNNARIHVDLSADICFTDSASSLIGDAVKSNNSISVYQSLMYSFNRQDRIDSAGNEGSAYTSTKGILSEQAPIMSNLVYTVKGESITGQLDETSKNYIELKNNQNIKNDIVDGITIAASFDLNYDSDTEISAQFPKRDDGSDDGTCVVGYSRIASSPQATKYSKTSTEINGDALYYCEMDSAAKLYYNAKLRPDSSSDEDEVDVNDADIDDLDQLGINAYDPITSDTEHISTVAVYDVSTVANSALKDAKKIKLEFHLRGKWDNYTEDLEFDKYLQGFVVSANNTNNTNLTSFTGSPWTRTVSNDRTTITYVCDLTQSDEILSYNPVTKMYTFWVDFDAYTGDDLNTKKFRINNNKYSNYQILLKVDMLKTQDNQYSPIAACATMDHVIYTNARVNTGIVTTYAPRANTNNGD